MSEMVPAQFKICWANGGAGLSCARPGCHWWESVNGDPLTEVVALAREHLEEEHRG